MNVFIISPGRTGTTTLAKAMAEISGYTAAHESRVKHLGADRIAYPASHIECDNRLAWFMPRLTNEYGRRGVLVIVWRDQELIANSYNKRWHKINIMKAYAQGILMRDLRENDLAVCRDYVENVYEHLEYHRKDWQHSVDVDLAAPVQGVSELLAIIDRNEAMTPVLDVLQGERLNQNEATFKRWATTFKFNMRNVLWDMVR